MTNKKAMVLKSGLMVLNTMGSTYKVKKIRRFQKNLRFTFNNKKQERNKAKENSSGQMDHNTKDNSQTTTSTDLELTLGLMEEITREIGRITRWMDKENSSGQVKKNMKLFNKQ